MDLRTKYFFPKTKIGEKPFFFTPSTKTQINPNTPPQKQNKNVSNSIINTKNINNIPSDLPTESTTTNTRKRKQNNSNKGCLSPFFFLKASEVNINPELSSLEYSPLCCVQNRKFYLIDFESTCTTSDGKPKPCEIGICTLSFPSFFVHVNEISPQGQVLDSKTNSKLSFDEGKEKPFHRFLEVDEIPKEYQQTAYFTFKYIHHIPFNGFEHASKVNIQLWNDIVNYVGFDSSLSSSVQTIEDSSFSNNFHPIFVDPNSEVVCTVCSRKSCPNKRIDPIPRMLYAKGKQMENGCLNEIANKVGKKNNWIVEEVEDLSIFFMRKFNSTAKKMIPLVWRVNEFICKKENLCFYHSDLSGGPWHCAIGDVMQYSESLTRLPIVLRFLLHKQNKQTSHEFITDPKESCDKLLSVLLIDDHQLNEAFVSRVLSLVESDVMIDFSKLVWDPNVLLSSPIWKGSIS